MTERTGRRRVLLKLSGEAFGAGQLGVNPDVVSQIAREIAEAVDRVEVAVVVGRDGASLTPEKFSATRLLSSDEPSSTTMISVAA